MDMQIYKEQMDTMIPGSDLVAETKKEMRERLPKASNAKTSILYRPRLAAAIVIMMLVITVSSVALAATGAFRTHIEPPPDSFEAEQAYAIENFKNNVMFSQPYYTREQLAQHFIDTGGIEYYAPVRQPHIQPVSLNPDNGISLCNNTVFAIIDKQRVCFSCGYIFIEQQNIDIGWSSDE